MTRPIASLGDVKGFPMAPEGGSDRFGAIVAPLSDELGLSGLGVTLITVEPGKSGFPFHNHLANDEMFIILEGEGIYRFGNSEHPIKAGDVCGAPRGGADTAHQIMNTVLTPLKYVAVSTRIDPEVVEYPDSGKYAALAIWPGQSFSQAHLRVVGRAENTLDYWDGEDV